MERKYAKSRSANRLWLCIAALSAALPVEAQWTEYAVAPEESRIEVHVPRAGLLKALGHDHTIRVQHFEGSLQIDPEAKLLHSLEIRIPVRFMSVIDPEAKEDTRTKVEETMKGEQVLDAAAYPEIVFRAESVSIDHPTKWKIPGTLSIRGEQRFITLPVAVHRPLDSRLRASGVVRLKPEHFGISPVSALGGAVRTAETIEIQFELTANGLPSAS